MRQRVTACRAGWRSAIPAVALLTLPHSAGSHSSTTPTQVRHEWYRAAQASRELAPSMLERLTARQAERLGPRVRYLANEGVMLEGSRGRVLIDALFGDGLPEYPTVPRATRDSLERAAGPYGGPAVVLVTHAHRDHFDSAAVARYRGHNRAAVVIGPPPPGAAPAPPVDLGWVHVQPLAIPHGPTRRPIGHAAYLITLDGTTALHLGDTQSDPETWRAAGVPESGVDIALVPYWYALEDGRLEAAMEVLRARTVVLFHAMREDFEWAEKSRALRDRYPHVRTPVLPGDVAD